MPTTTAGEGEHSECLRSSTGFFGFRKARRRGRTSRHAFASCANRRRSSVPKSAGLARLPARSLPIKDPPRSHRPAGSATRTPAQAFYIVIACRRLDLPRASTKESASDSRLDLHPTLHQRSPEVYQLVLLAKCSRALKQDLTKLCLPTNANKRWSAFATCWKSEEVRSSYPSPQTTLRGS